MAAKKAKHTTTELRIVFDTNILHNQSASELVRQEVAQLLTDNANHDDLTLSWFIPESVRLERRYQMLERGNALLPSIQKMEKLLAHNLNITADVVRERVDANIAGQLASLGLAQLALDSTAVDWTRVLHDAASRAAPFEHGEKEKGFRDLLIGEAFIQLAEASPATPTVCRVILVSGDERLREMVQKRIRNQANVKLFANIDELRGFINTLASKVSEEFVDKYRAAAGALFYTPDDQGTLWYAKQVGNEIRQRFAVELAAPPSGATIVEQGRFAIAAPEFVKKNGQRIHWSSRFTIPLTAFRYETDPAQQVVASGMTTVSGPTLRFGKTGVMFGGEPQDSWSFKVAPASGLPNRYAEILTGIAPSPGVLQTFQTNTRKIEVRKGQALVDVHWSVTVRTNGKLTGPSMDNWTFVEATWT